MLYFIDAGHGPETQGKATPEHLWQAFGKGVREYEANRRVAHELEARLKHYGHTVVRTYADSRDWQKRYRCKVANEYATKDGEMPDCALISIHHNAFAVDPLVRGLEVHIAERASITSVAIANEIAKQAEEAGVWMRKYPVKRSTFTMLTDTVMPAVLVECAYMTNIDDVAAILGTAWPIKMAKVISRALQQVHGW